MARARNVSEGGMFVSVPGAVSIGAEVSCEVSIDGVRHHMRARVAWVHRDSPDRPAALGLEFCALEQDQAAALRTLLTTAEPVRDRSRVWFDGIREPVVGRTEHFEGGAVLRSALPFLELGRHVRLDDGSGDPAARAGRIASIALETEPDSKVPYLRIEFALDADREAVDADDLEVEIIVEPAEETPRTRTVRRWTRAVIAAGALTGLSCIVLAAHLASPDAGSQAAANHVVLTPHVTAPVLPEPPPPPVPAQEEARPVAVITTPPVPAAAPPSIDGPQIRIGATTEIEIPLVGSTDGEAHYSLDEPPGLAINLPRAAIAFPYGDTHVGKGGVRFVRITRRLGGIQVRLHFSGDAAPRYDVAVETDRVRLSVHPDE